MQKVVGSSPIIRSDRFVVVAVYLVTPSPGTLGGADRAARAAAATTLGWAAAEASSHSAQGHPAPPAARAWNAGSRRTRAEGDWRRPRSSRLGRTAPGGR